MDIKHIITFIKVAELKNFTKAAKELQYAQSTVSFQIRSLEKELGIQLFERNYKRLELTERGHLSLNICKKLRDNYYKLLDVSTQDEHYNTPIQIGSVGSFLIYRLSEVIKLYKATYPSINIQLNNKPSCEYSKLIKDNKIDLAFFVETDMNIIDESLELVHLNRDPMYLIYPPNYEFISIKKLSSDLTACVSEVGSSYRQILFDFHENLSLKTNTTIESWSIEMIKKCVSRGIGYSILPKICIIDELKSNSFNSILLDSSKYYVDLYLGYKKGRNLPLQIARLVELVNEESIKYKLNNL